MVNEDNDNYTQSHETLIAFWSVLIFVLVGILAAPLFRERKMNKLEKKMLYNFKKAPKTFVEEDSFILMKDDHD